MKLEKKRYEQEIMKQ